MWTPRGNPVDRDNYTSDGHSESTEFSLLLGRILMWESYPLFLAYCHDRDSSCLDRIIPQDALFLEFALAGSGLF
jgi:hypothetical protein